MLLCKSEVSQLIRAADSVLTPIAGSKQPAGDELTHSQLEETEASPFQIHSMLNIADSTETDGMTSST